MTITVTAAIAEVITMEGMGTTVGTPRRVITDRIDTRLGITVTIQGTAAIEVTATGKVGLKLPQTEESPVQILNRGFS